MTHAIALKSIPGPQGSPLKLIGELRRRGLLDYVSEAWATYGDLFQLDFGARKLTYALHPDMVRHINVTQRDNYDKLHSYEPTRRYLLGDGVLTSIGDTWRRQRRLMAPFYTPRGVQDYAGIMLRDGQMLVERWERLSQSGEVVEVSDEMTFVTASIILKAMFSMETDEEIIRLKDAVDAMIGFTSSRQATLIKLPLWVPSGDNQRYLRARKQVYTYINSVIAHRRALPQADWPDDLLTRLMQARDEETGLTMTEGLLRDESITTFFAGHETTARTLTFAWYALAANPAVMEQLAAELDTVLNGRVPTVDDLHHLPYTLQVIKETLRLYPPAPFYVRDARADDVIDGYAVSAGSSMMLSPYFTHRHPDFWPDPERFDPDRWTPERAVQQHPYAYHPFATGQRICIGNNFSLLETHILLALIAQKFTPRLADGFTPHWYARGTLGTTNGMPMRIERR